MLSRWCYIVAGAVLLTTYITAEILTPCEEEDDRRADKQSCTRYHICREDPDSKDDLLSDIAICPTMMVFDMVTSTCVDVKKGYLQDPAGCNTYYGCRLPSPSSEGYLRTRYFCPGELRFHPEDGFCTHKTNVPDTMCNSHKAVQSILGQQASHTKLHVPATDDGGIRNSGIASQSANISSNQTDDSTTDPPTAETTVGAPTEEEAETVDSNFSNNTIFRVVTPGERPAKPLTDIDKITQVIKGQLLTRRKASEVSSTL